DDVRSGRGACGSAREPVPADLVLVVAARGEDSEPVGGVQRQYRQTDGQEQYEQAGEGGADTLQAAAGGPALEADGACGEREENDRQSVVGLPAKDEVR